MLLGPDGLPIAPFSAYAYSLRNSAKNTLGSYCRHVAEFLDYLIEASSLQEGQMTKVQLTEAIEGYGDYLQFGSVARNSIARDVAFRLRPGVNSSASLAPKKAAIRRFLSLSENIRKEMAELAKLRELQAVPVDGDPLLPEIGKRRELQVREVLAMQTNSMLAGVLAGGPHFIHCVPLNSRGAENPFEQSRAFPFDRVMDLIDSMPTYRDKALYALLAASGCRTHEALQLLMDDINVLEGTIRLVDPALRASHPSFRAISVEQRAKLAWKGRTTQLTLLIEPFARKFFESLRGYFADERIPHAKHDFVFQYLVGTRRGAPYFLSAAASRLQQFRSACKVVGVQLPRGSQGHSLRHMYGTYLLNYFPRANGDYGLPPAMVQQLMGHANLDSTLKYARYDKDILKLEIQNANRVLFGKGAPVNIIELKIKALESQVSKLRSQLREGGGVHD